jgi:hypothetical protein
MLSVDDGKMLVTYVEQLEKSLTEASTRADQYKEAAYANTYRADPAKVREMILGASDVVSRADTVLNLCITNQRPFPAGFQYVVDLIKSRSQSPSRHGFQSSADLYGFLKVFLP